MKEAYCVDCVNCLLSPRGETEVNHVETGTPWRVLRGASRIVGYAKIWTQRVLVGQRLRQTRRQQG